MGKVHGGLAKVGRVRGLAPKVAKMEREGGNKPKTGRAKKRIQYNRRIAGVNPKDKRKQGPNAGSGRKPANSGSGHLR